MSTSNRENDITLIIKATNFAAQAHRKQMRKDGINPFINHPIGVANILTEIGSITDPEVICAALLHDTIEDTDVTSNDIQNQFGERIRSIVEEVTDDKSLPKEKRKHLQIVNASKCSVEAKLVKLADKLHNLKDLLENKPIGWSDERIQEYFEWSAEVIKGLLGTNTAMELELIFVLSKRNVNISYQDED